MVITNSKLVLGATAVTLAIIAITSIGIHSRGQALFQSSPKDLIDEVWQIVDRQYVDGTFNQQDWQAVRQQYLSKSYSNPQEAYKAVREMLKTLDDPFTRFMDPEQYKSMEVDTSGELVGIGITIGLDEKTKQLVVIAPIEDTPAFKAGILSRDIIISIDGKSTKGMDINQAVDLIRGPVNTSVQLTVLRNKQEKQISVARAKIEIHPVHYSLRPTPAGNLGYIRLNQFSANASQEMSDAIKNLETKHVSGYVIDLRGNPGGLYQVSLEIARMWLNNGTIVSTIDRQGDQVKEVAQGNALTNKPLVILVDKGSASSSEILSGALQDNKRAVLVGTQTFGKGLVQTVRQLYDGSAVAVTIARYHTPSGSDINKRGIAPNFKVELTEAQKRDLLNAREKIGTLADPQFAKAVSVLREEAVLSATNSPRKN
jgi:carboxyl-terminal processing protease